MSPLFALVMLGMPFMPFMAAAPPVPKDSEDPGAAAWD